MKAFIKGIVRCRFNGIFAMLETGTKFYQHGQMYEKYIYRKFLDFSISIKEVKAITSKWVKTIDLVCILIND